MNIIIHPDFQFLRSFIESLPSIFPNAGVTIYEGRNVLKEFEANGVSIIVKRYRKPIFVNQIVYAHLRPSKAKRAYQFGVRVSNRGINTPQPVAFIEVKKNGLLIDSYFVSLKCNYTRLMREFCEESVSGKEDILIAFAQFTANMHDNGIYHKDFSAGNILFEKDEKGIRFSIVDINRMEFGPVSEEKGYRNFYRIWFTDEAFRIVGREYGIARGFDPDKSLERVLYYKNKFMESCK